MFKNESTNKLMSMAVVAMMMLCAFSVCFAAGSDADTPNANQSYTIDIRNGQTFSYTPTVNLTDATIAAVTEESTATGYTYNGKGTTLTYSPSNITESTNPKIVLQATWNSPTSGSSLSQTVKQTIEFDVWNWTVLKVDNTTYDTDSTIEYYAIVGDEPSVFGTHTITKEGSASTAGNINFGAFAMAGGSSPKFTFNSSTGVLSQSAEATEDDIGTWTATVSVTDPQHNSLPAQTRTLTIKINVVADIALAINSTYETAKGTNVANAINTATATYSPTDTYPNVTWTFDATGADTGFFTHADNSATVSWDPSKATGSDSGKQYKTNQFTITVNSAATQTIPAASASKTVSVITWDALVFMDAPSVSNVAASVGTGAFANDVTVSAAFTAAKRIVYNWGDGTSTSTNVELSETAKNYSAHHIYSVPGAYQVCITAYNDMGETSSIVLVTANGFGDAAPESDYTITVKDKTGANILGYFYVNEGQKLADVEFTPAEGVSFDAETQKLSALFENAAAGSAALGGKTADLCAVVTQNDIYYAEIVEKGFFDYHGWDFILFAVLAILSIVVYLYFYCHPAMPVLAVVFAILAVASYLCGGITEIIPALQAAWNSWFPPAQ